jgi:hypothetical protein
MLVFESTDRGRIHESAAIPKVVDAAIEAERF